MQAVIFAYDPASLEGRCTTAEQSYHFKLSRNLGCAPGDSCEIEPIEDAPGETQVIKILPLELETPDLVITRSHEIPDHKVADINSEFVLKAEGPDPTSCVQALRKAVQGHNVNALLNFKLASKSKRFGKGLLWTAEATMARVRGPVYRGEEGKALTFDRNLIRRNSPNGAMIRYRALLLVCALLVAVPCILRLGQRGLMGPLFVSQALCVLLILLCIYHAFTYFPKTIRVFLHKRGR